MKKESKKNLVFVLHLDGHTAELLIDPFHFSHQDGKLLIDQSLFDNHVRQYPFERIQPFRSFFQNILPSLAGFLQRFVFRPSA
jgi:hypothetical protein